MGGTFLGRRLHQQHGDKTLKFRYQQSTLHVLCLICLVGHQENKQRGSLIPALLYPAANQIHHLIKQRTVRMTDMSNLAFLCFYVYLQNIRNDCVWTTRRVGSNDGSFLIKERLTSQNSRFGGSGQNKKKTE